MNNIYDFEKFNQIFIKYYITQFLAFSIWYIFEYFALQAFTAPEVPKDLPKEIKKNKNFLRKISLGTLGSLGIKEDGKIFHLVL